MTLSLAKSKQVIAARF